MQLMKNKNQQVFVELTNKIHGGPGWSLGTCLWSPEKGRDGKDVWGTMRKVNIGDIIIHSLKTYKGHQFDGISTVASTCEIDEFGPPTPGKWEGYDNYYRVELENYCCLEPRIPMQKFLDDHKDVLHSITGSFFTSELKPAEKYLASVNDTLFELMANYFNNNCKTLIEGMAGFIEKDNNSLKSPDKKKYSGERIIRNTKIIKKLKNTYSNRCQICNKTIKVLNNNFYSEGHHIQPLGGAHRGYDVEDNIIIVCPEHHIEFDYGAIAIHPKTLKILHIDPENKYHNQELSYQRRDLDAKYLEYHYKNIFNKTK